MSDAAGRRTALLLLQRMDDGGAQVLVTGLACRLARHGWLPVVVCWGEGGPRLDALASRGVDVHALGLPRVGLGRPLAFAATVRRAVRAVARLVAHHDARVLHAHLHESNFIAAEVAARTSRPAILTLHTVQMAPNRRPGTLRHRLRIAAVRRAARRAAAVVAVGDSVAAAFRDVAPGRPVSVIRNGVPLDAATGADRDATRRALGLSAGAPVVVTVGRLVPLKRHGDLLAAVAVLRRARPETTLLVVGDGPERDALERRAAELDVASAVRWLGRRDDVPALLAASDVFALPSAWEGVSLALLEAMAAGLPPVATAVGGNAEVIEDGGCGLLVPAGDAGALAAAIDGLLADPALARRVGRAARERVAARHDIERTVAETVALYERVSA